MGKIAAALEKSGNQFRATQPLRPHGPPEASETDGLERSEQRTETIQASGKLDPSLIAISQVHPFVVEQFKQLKTHLLFNCGELPRLLMITSALPGEGKSFVAANLAASLAQNIKEHVLLIDCDLRRPAIHRLFGLKNPPGLSEYLQNDRDLSEYLVKTVQNKLTLIPAGASPENPLELLSSEKMAAMLEEVKQRYRDRFVILDSPPPRLTAETSALAKRADAVLLVIKKDGADRDIISDLVGKIGKEKIAGVVFNYFERPKISALGYGKYGKYGKYHGHYK